MLLLPRAPSTIVARLTQRPKPGALPQPVAVTLPPPHHPQKCESRDVLVAADRIAVVAAWEQAREHGIGVAAVHALSDPDSWLTHSIVDVRERYGVWVAVMTHDGDERASRSADLAGPLVVPARPRQATMHKNVTAMITDVDDNVSRMFGWTREQLLGARSSEFVHPDDQERAVGTWTQLLSTRARSRGRPVIA